MENNIEDIVREQVHCPNTSCEEEKTNQCYTHAYILCPTFEDWYNSGGREKMKSHYEKQGRD